jgi:putative ABC transport system permease protein
MGTFVRDLRYGLRTLRSTPAFTLAAVLTLALGMGATTAIFSVVERVLLRPLPFEDAGRLVVLRQAPPSGGHVFEWSYPDYADLRRETRSFEDLAVVPYSVSRFVWTGADPAPARGALVSGNLFSVLGVRPAIGRAFLPDEDRRGAEKVVVIGDGLWRRRFGADPAVVGRIVTLNAESYRVVGVLPPGFEYPARTELWVPVVAAVDSLAEARQVGFLDVVGRIRPGVTPAAATADAQTVLDRLSELYRPSTPRAIVTATPLAEDLLGDVRPALLVLLAAAGLVLLIACANVANLLLARASVRRAEMAVRTALGASRSRLVQQLLAESLLLAGMGAVLGVVVGFTGLDLLLAVVPPDLPRIEGVGLDPWVLAFCGGVTLAAAVAFGLLPALRSSGSTSGLDAASRRLASSGGRLARGLVVGEIALAALVLVGSGLLIRSLSRLQSVDLGFDRESTLSIEVFLPEARYAEPAAVRAFYDRLVERAAALPGVTRAAGVLVRPLQGPDGFDYPFSIEGRSADEQATYPLLNYEAITPDYFSASGIPLLSGRPFQASDDEDAPGVVIVSRGLARRFWPGADPIGRRIKWGPPDGPAPWLTIVGVAGDARYRALQSPTLDVYVPYRQSPWGLNHLIVRAAGDPAALAGALAREARAIDPGVATLDAATARELVDSALRRPRFNTLLLGFFAAAALALAGVGIYGVTSYAAARRTREMGIRMALGAGPGQVRRLVIGQALRAGAVGIAIGLAAALAGTRLLSGLLFEVRPADPLTFAAVPIFLALVAALAGWVPARRAAKLAPTAALRAE